MDWVAVDAVLIGPVSNPNSLITGKITGNLENLCLQVANPANKTRIFISLRVIPCSGVTGNFKRVTGNHLGETGSAFVPQGHVWIRTRMMDESIICLAAS
jgi:hypothetical protein